MDSIVGFTAMMRFATDNKQAALAAHAKAFSASPHLNRTSILIGATQLEVWGRGQPRNRVHSLPDGSLLALIGSPFGPIVWSDVEIQLARAANPEDFHLPWDGRVILLKISADGMQWTMWNDWIGSIPVFHVENDHVCIASTLEPVVVDTASLSLDKVCWPGLVAWLIHGHLIGEWTLFENMRVVPPDCVAQWDDASYRWHTLRTIVPTTDRWETEWEYLVDEMYELSRQVIGEVLKSQQRWIVPLSGGIDSRLIAAVGANAGIDILTYTYGPPRSREVVCAEQVAQALKLPWKWIDLGKTYLADHAANWANWFGSSLHFNGIYWIAFLDKLSSEPSGPLAVGFLGDTLGHDAFIGAAHLAHKHQLVSDGYVRWLPSEVTSLLRCPIQDSLARVAVEIEHQLTGADGALFQRQMFLELHNRQRQFTSFYPTLCDSWRVVATPYLNRAYARFCFSLPIAAIESGRLMGEMFRKHYAKLAAIPGTYAPDPYLLTGSYLLKRRLSTHLPSWLATSLTPEFSPVAGRMDQDCVRATGAKAFWPVFEAWEQLDAWIDTSKIPTINDTVSSSTVERRSLRMLQSLQPVAYRLIHGNAA